MFDPNLPPQPQTKAVTKREHLRQQIRNRQIESIKKQIRMKYYQFKDQSDYQLLKQINIPKLISQCKKHGLFYCQQSERDGESRNGRNLHVHALFLYASSKNCDHLFQMIDDRFYCMLVDGLVGEGEGDEVVWNRELLWILTNYTAYSQIVHENYLNKLQIIASHLFTQQHRHPFLQQTQQNLTLSISNIISNSKSCRKLLQTHQNILYTIITHLINREPSLVSMLQPPKSIPKLLYYFSDLLHNYFTVVEYGEIPELFSQSVVKVVVRIIQGGLGDGFMGEEEKKLPDILLHALIRLFGNSVDNCPEIILKHKRQIKRLSVWFEMFIKSQKQSAKSDTIIIAYLQFLAIVYGPNIPEELQNKISKFYLKHFEEHVGRVCTSVFMSKNSLFHTYALRLLQPIFMEQYLAQMIVTQYLPIVSHIFDHIKNSTYTQKSEALICLVNMIKSTLYNNSTSAPEVLELLLANNIADILACNLWGFVDTDLNLQLLAGIQILIQEDKNQYGAKLRFWQKFKQAGGVLKMQKILDESVSTVLKQEVNKILQSVAFLQQT